MCVMYTTVRLCVWHCYSYFGAGRQCALSGVQAVNRLETTREKSIDSFTHAKRAWMEKSPLPASCIQQARHPHLLEYSMAAEWQLPMDKLVLVGASTARMPADSAETFKTWSRKIIKINILTKYIK